MFESSESYKPFSEAAEQDVLASLLAGGALASVSSLIEPRDFYGVLEGHVLSVMVGMDADKRVIDESSLLAALESHGKVERMEALQYVVALAGSGANKDNAETYAMAVKDLSNERQIIIAANEMISAIKHGEGSSKERQNNAMSAFHAVDTETHVQKHMKVQLREFVAEFEAKCQIKTELTGIPTGLKSLDKVTGGYQKSDYIVIAARPAMGKTTVGVNCMVSTAKAMVKKAECVDELVMIFSMEMPASQLIGRIVSSEGLVKMNSIKAPGVNLGENGCAGFDGFNAGIRKVHQLVDNMVIDDRPAVSAPMMRAACLSAERKYGKKIGAVLVDYVQIMPGKGEDTQRISGNSTALKALAMELDCPVVTLAQLNRDVEKRQDKRPRSSDIKGAGQIEQDADIIILIHSDDESDDIDRNDGRGDGFAIFIIDKFRGGECTDVIVKKDLSFSRFKDHVPEHY